MRARQTPAAVSALAGRTLRFREIGVAGVLALTIVVAGAVNPALLTSRNITDMLVQCAPALIVACGLTFVIVVGEIDISVGSLLGLLGAVMGVLASPQRLGLPVGLSIVATLGVGAGVGLLNGLLVTLGRVPSIVVTLGMLTALRGVTELVMAGQWITDLPPGLRMLGTGAWLGAPLSIWAAAGCAILSLWLAHRTPMGRRFYAIGSNPGAARVAGLPIAPAKLLAFTITGLLTAVAALVSIPQLSVIESGLGTGFELLVVTAVLVGGTSIRGGSGSIVGTLLAVLLLGIVRTVLLFLKLGDTATYWERAIQGAFILVAVVTDPAARFWSRRGARGSVPARQAPA
jgi:ribose/xylose/arabinose/galactoside ABC-type transport system permease subunit